MVSLGNQARLLAAQAFNKQVLLRKAQARQAEIEAERRKDLLRTTRRLEIAKLSARNAVERGRIQDAIDERLRSATEKARQAKINAEAKRKSALAFSRVAKGSNIGILTGFEARKDSRGRTIGISAKESKTRLQTKALLRKEIARQQKIAREGTDLERFLKNERRLNAGQISFSELKQQIAKRKARGLSKTPAQKRAFFRLRGEEDLKKLTARNRRKGRSNPAAKARATLALKRSEADRAGALGSRPFIDPLFAGGGRSQEAIIGRGGTFGRRQAGESISSQLSFISSAKARSTSARIGFAQGLLSNLNFSGSSQASLLSIVGNKKIRTPKTFQQELRAGVGFFTTVQKPVTKPTLSKARRGQLVAFRKAEDFAKTEKARKKIARQGSSLRQPVFDLEAFGQSLTDRAFARGRQIERENLSRQPRFSGEFTLSPPRVQRQQAQAPTPISFIEPRGRQDSLRSIFGGDLAEGVSARDLLSQRPTSLVPTVRAGVLTPQERRKQAQARQDETKLIRETPFVSGGLVPATGRPSSTETFFPDIPSPDRNIFNVSLSESIGISDILSPTPVRAPTPRATKTGKKKKTTRPPPDQFDVLNPAGLIAPAPVGVANGRPPASDPFADIFGGVGEAVGGAISGVGETFGGISDTFGSFLAIGRESGGTDLLTEAASFENLFGAGESLASGDFFSQFDVDPSFDPAEAGRRTAEILT